MARGEPVKERLVQDYTSRWYPKRYSGTGFLYHSRVVTQMLEGIKFRDGRHSDKILDVGCGIGFVSQLYPNFDITGIDISDGMLACNPHHWLKARAESIPFEDNTFDFVICRSLLHHLDDPKLGLVEMYRVLKPGGKWVCWDPHHGLIYGLIRKLLQRTDRFSHLHKSFNAEQLFNLIEGVGFKIMLKRYMGYLAYPLLGFPDIMDFGMSIGAGRTLMSLDEWIGKTILRKLSWALMVKAVKP